MKILGNRIIVEELEVKATNGLIVVDIKDRFYKARVLASNEIVPGTVVLVDRQKAQPIDWEGQKAALFEMEDVIAVDS